MVAEGMGLTLMPELAGPKKQTKKDAKPSRRIGLLYRRAVIVSRRLGIFRG